MNESALKVSCAPQPVAPRLCSWLKSFERYEGEEILLSRADGTLWCYQVSMGASTSSSVRPGPDPPPAVASTPPTSKHVQPGAGAPPTGAGSRGGSSLSPLCTSDPSRPANTGGRKGSHSRSMTASESVRGSDSIQQDSLSVEQVPRRPSKSLSPVQLGNGGHVSVHVCCIPISHVASGAGKGPARTRHLLCLNT
jgi:hypothetical protein